ncbi:carbon-nitrogen hydrolase [Fragilariopsis cylindrus CCMP1102]|uniref:Carbon-nitrogen hydrolase n=1 Tax=Fragilariopsis cylindrus CCMP1102 TaxID=635003 RepID=A0A1E7FBH7_9STRA|nr:carbon-nitrogen hydrolase [Fragilariopsis cylindrus CCMP1102]|eukprot:OEU15528.1 carbon-nitrogen hydrolase [Fragilariopsis cylindrus CCMP1102]
MSSSSSSSLPIDGDKIIVKPIAAIAQLKSTSNKVQNLIDVAICARLAKSKGASMLFLPECFGFIGESSIQTLEEADDPIHLTTAKMKTGTKMENDEALTLVRSIMEGLRTISKESGLWLSGGGMHVLAEPPNSDDASDKEQRVYNTHVIIDSDGVLRCQYRKIHLFDVSIPGKVQLQESKTTAPGTELVMCDSPIGRLGVTTCYDLRFPEMYIELVKMGAQILLVPSAFTVPTGAAHWHTLLRARAIENQCYVLAAAQFGKHNEKRESFGHSLAVDPWGRVVADAGGYPKDDMDENKSEIEPPPSIVTVEIDPTLIDSIRQRMPVDVHRSNASF